MRKVGTSEHDVICGVLSISLIKEVLLYIKFGFKMFYLMLLSPLLSIFTEILTIITYLEQLAIIYCIPA